MVKGTTRQVVVVKGPDPKLFEQAIFLVRDEVLMEGGVTEEALLQEARQVCIQSNPKKPLLHHLLWSAYGAAAMGMLWLMTALLSLA